MDRSGNVNNVISLTRLPAEASAQAGSKDEPRESRGLYSEALAKE